MNVFSPVQTELTGGSQDVNHTLHPQLLAQNGGGDETSSSTNSSTADEVLEEQQGGVKGQRRMEEERMDGVLISNDPSNFITAKSSLGKLYRQGNRPKLIEPVPSGFIDSISFIAKTAVKVSPLLLNLTICVVLLNIVGLL